MLLYPSWLSIVHQEGLLSLRARLLVPSMACPQLLLLTFLLLQDLLLLLGTDGERRSALVCRQGTRRWLSCVLLAGSGDGGKAGQILISSLLSSALSKAAEVYFKAIEKIGEQALQSSTSRVLGKALPLATLCPVITNSYFFPLAGPFPSIVGIKTARPCPGSETQIYCVSLNIPRGHSTFPCISPRSMTEPSPWDVPPVMEFSWKPVLAEASCPAS